MKLKPLTKRQSRNEVIEYLRELGNGEVDAPLRKFMRHINPSPMGICVALFHLFRGGDIPDAIGCQWPKYSGDTSFPISHHSRVPSDAYLNLPRWDENQYGDDRRELALWLADMMEEFL